MTGTKPSRGEVGTHLPDDLLRSPEWQSRIDTVAAKHHVPGAEVGVIGLGSDGPPDVRVMVTGVTSLATEVDVSPDTLFQFGSISKVWTTTLIMQLVDDGLLSLDTKVVEVLPEFTLADPDAAAEIRVRHLLTHTSGIDGDVFLDTGDGDDCVEKYVKELRTAVSVTVPGGPLSYCNAGFVVAGRIVEVLRGNVWDDVLVERIYQPLGLDHVITRAKDAPLFRTAVGHVKIGAGTDEVTPVTTWMLPRSMGPAGLITGSAESLLTFGAAHLRDGLGLTGERIVSAESAQLMRTLHTSLSAVSSTQQGWGLGWNLEQWGAETSVSHLGGTIGQVASLHTFHEQQVAIVSLANSRGGDGFNRQMRTLVGSALGLTAPTPRIDGDAADVDLSGLVGTYDSTLTRWQITQDADRRLWIGMTSKNTVLGEPDPEPQLMKPAGRDRFLATVGGAEMEFAYLEYAGKHYLYNLRLYERADASA